MSVSCDIMRRSPAGITPTHSICSGTLSLYHVMWPEFQHYDQPPGVYRALSRTDSPAKGHAPSRRYVGRGSEVRYVVLDEAERWRVEGAVPGEDGRGGVEEMRGGRSLPDFVVRRPYRTRICKSYVLWC